ncbi:MAG TPA: hypothetical protein VGS58_14485 [Candidatus Sulfopaludibacter sp.]|nr:hypothetical protein [Candidatus Sulfopaludibacter sp.]
MIYINSSESNRIESDSDAGAPGGTAPSAPPPIRLSTSEISPGAAAWYSRSDLINEFRSEPHKWNEEEIQAACEQAAADEQRAAPIQNAKLFLAKRLFRVRKARSQPNLALATLATAAPPMQDAAPENDAQPPRPPAAPDPAAEAEERKTVFASMRRSLGGAG